MPTLIQCLGTGPANGIVACSCLALVLIHIDSRKLDRMSGNASEEKRHERRLDNDRKFRVRMNDQKQQTANE